MYGTLVKRKPEAKIVLNIPKKHNLAVSANPFVTAKKQDEAAETQTTSSTSPQKHVSKEKAINQNHRPGTSATSANPQHQNNKENSKSSSERKSSKSSLDKAPPSSLNSLQRISESYCDTDSSTSNPSSPSQRKSPPLLPLSPTKKNKKNAAKEGLSSSTPHKKVESGGEPLVTASSPKQKSDLNLDLDTSKSKDPLAPSKRAKEGGVLTDSTTAKSGNNDHNSISSNHNKSGNSSKHKHHHHHHTTLSRNSIWSPTTKGTLQHKIFFNRHTSSSSHGSTSSTTSSTTTSPTKHEATAATLNGAEHNMYENRVVKTVSGNAYTWLL